MPINLIKVFTDDFETIYINGIKEFEDDSINIDDVLVSIEGFTIGKFQTYYLPVKILEDKYGWDFPVEFSDIDIKDLE